MDCQILSVLILFALLIIGICIGVAINYGWQEGLKCFLFIISTLIAIGALMYFFVYILPHWLCAWHICKCS
jgi:hypothetical protein